MCCFGQSVQMRPRFAVNEPQIANRRHTHAHADPFQQIATPLRIIFIINFWALQRTSFSMYLDIFPFQSRFELHLKRWHLLQKFDNICLSVCLFVCPAIENEINREVSSLCRSSYLFLASQYALEAMRVTESLSH